MKNKTIIPNDKIQEFLDWKEEKSNRKKKEKEKEKLLLKE